MNKSISPQRNKGTEKEDQLTNAIIDAAVAVHRELGPGLLKSVYEEALCVELTMQNLAFKRQIELPLVDKGSPLSTTFRLDLVVENSVVIEMKAVSKLLPVHEAQLISYLKLSGIGLGLLINFHESLLKQGIKRQVLNLPKLKNAVPLCLCDEKHTSQNIVTEQLTQAGRKIEHSSFAIVDAEAGDRGSYTEQQWPLVRRMIHATADFEFNGLTEFHPDAMQAGLKAIAAGAPIVADVEMICVGLSKPRLTHFGVATHQFISDDDVIENAKREATTRAVQAMRKAHRAGLLDGAIIGVGNAPTALLEVIRLIREEGVRPALIVGMPVGFVSAAESKDAVAAQSETPWVITRGRKGGSTLVVSAIHAMLALAEAQETNP
ncbi:MAG: precorrin-8X methylmutase [Mariprofundales bacterium]|nr:precorrin-8X methylmutase [Mariprofundales bacterium]